MAYFYSQVSRFLHLFRPRLFLCQEEGRLDADCSAVLASFAGDQPIDFVPGYLEYSRYDYAHSIEPVR